MGSCEQGNESYYVTFSSIALHCIVLYYIVLYCIVTQPQTFTQSLI
jgi:hypothetical protein